MVPTPGVRPDRFHKSVLVDKRPAAARLQRRAGVLSIETAALRERRESMLVAPSGRIGVRYPKEPPRAFITGERLRSPPPPALDELGLRVGAGAPSSSSKVELRAAELRAADRPDA